MHPTYFNASLRIKLDDFIGQKIEDDVIKRIELIYEKTRYPFQTLFWFEDEKLMAKELKRFVDNTQNKLPFKTTIKSLNNIKVYNFAWFNLVSNEDKNKVNEILLTSLVPYFGPFFSSVQILVISFTNYHKSFIFFIISTF